MKRWFSMVPVLLLPGILVSVDTGIVRGETASPGGSAARVVEGRVIDGRGTPIEGAAVVFGPGDPPRLLFTEEAMARTNAQGHYRVDLTKFPWGALKLRYLALAPGFGRAIGTVEAGKGVSDIELTTAPWKTTQFRMMDSDGRPVSGAEMTCSVEHQAVWSRLKASVLPG